MECLILQRFGSALCRWALLCGIGISLVAAPSFPAGAREDPALVEDNTPPAPPPNIKGLIVYFSGKPEEVAQNFTLPNSTKPASWPVTNGSMLTTGSSIVTKDKFMDFHLHVEFKEPYMPAQHGQERGNSGIGLQGRYEIQILDSYGWGEPGAGDCGAVYSQSGPLVNACKPPLQWQTYDIVFHAPRFDASGKKSANARVTVIQNGIVVQNNTAIRGFTGLQIDKDEDKPGPILLQYHNNPMRFRNVWVLPLSPLVVH